MQNMGIFHHVKTRKFNEICMWYLKSKMNKKQKVFWKSYFFTILTVATKTFCISTKTDTYLRISRIIFFFYSITILFRLLFYTKCTIIIARIQNYTAACPISFARLKHLSYERARWARFRGHPALYTKV